MSKLKNVLDFLIWGCGVVFWYNLLNLFFNNNSTLIKEQRFMIMFICVCITVIILKIKKYINRNSKGEYYQ